MPPDPDNVYMATSPLPSEEQIVSLIEQFNQYRSHISCPNCSAKGHFHRNGTNKNSDVPQPLFCCVSCGGSYQAYIIHRLIEHSIAFSFADLNNTMTNDFDDDNDTSNNNSST